MPRPKSSSRNAPDGALQVRHRDPAVHDERLGLVEDGRVRRVHFVVSVDAARHDQPQRRAALAHLADLDGRGVRAQEQRRRRRPVDEERVLRVARRMLRRKVQRLEVVVVVLELRTVGDRVAHAEEDALDPPPHDRDRVQAAGSRAPRRERRIDGRAGLARLRLASGGGPRRSPRSRARSRAWPRSRARRTPRARTAGSSREPGEERRHESLLAPEEAALQPLELGARGHTPPPFLAKRREDPSDRVFRVCRRQTRTATPSRGPAWRRPRAARRRRGPTRRARRASCG